MNFPLIDSSTVFTVTQITSIIKEIIEGTFPSIVLEGEISNYKPSTSGHCYFTLKDSTAQISAVMFKASVMKLSFIPKDGMLVRCTGKLSVYAARGNYQIIVSAMQLAGEGDILQMLEERKRKLASEGLFDQNRKKQLPAFPKIVGVVTSATGAALRDILQITKRRNSSVSVIIFPAIVQGNDSASSIVHQIKVANTFHLCDVLIVGRGGGSLEDLLPFSEESVVRAIADSVIPVVSAVGHEIDWALSDYAADVRAPTPSAAAELVIPQKADILAEIQQYKNELYTSMQGKVDTIKVLIKSYTPENMELLFRTIEQPLLSRFDALKISLLQNMDKKLKDTLQKIKTYQTILEGANPTAILSRGYAVVRDTRTNKIIRSSQDTSVGAQLEIIPAQGAIIASVTHLQMKEAQHD
ncbi:MAG: exodeoxyribonuclease VII large subunit [Treponema sp.]|nr:exodeoxyribonuclease VII large subunit [Treponema sp.]